MSTGKNQGKFEPKWNKLIWLDLPVQNKTLSKSFIPSRKVQTIKAYLGEQGNDANWR